MTLTDLGFRDASGPAGLTGGQASADDAGPLTFLFTDIEGSTRRWELHTQAMQGALERHDALLNAAISGHGGKVFKTVGDAFYAVFVDPAAAVEASLAAQRGLHAEVWGEAGPLLVRIALHMGVPSARDGDYFGPPLNRVARLLSAGHGGQILLSAAVAEVTGNRLPADAALRDMGERRLKDLAKPEHVYQLVVPDLPAEFPPLNTLDARPNNLPAQPTSMVGRDREVEASRVLLRSAEVRLMTLTGPGGIGKTRLGLQVAADLADDFQDGVYYVPLADISDSDGVAPTIARALSIREVDDRSLVERLKEHLRHKQLLLLLDNFERVLGAASLMAALLAAAPHLKLLITSQARLHIRGEREISVQPLELPNLNRLPPLDELAHFPAVALFVERAESVKRDFQLTADNAAAVAEICHRLDGSPLAIELAAARLKVLSPTAMLARLGQRLPLLTGGHRDLPERHQTLRAAIAWSHGLLEEEEQVLFRRLAAFRGGCSFETAEEVCAVASDVGIDVLNALGSLVDKSLLRQEEDVEDSSRFKMLESIREFASEELKRSGEALEVQRKHAAAFLTLAEQAEPELAGPQRATWLNRLELEHDNLRGALQWSTEAGEGDERLRLGGAMWTFWSVRGHWSEGREWLERALAADAASGGDPCSAARAKALGAAGNLARMQGDQAAALELQEEGLRIWRLVGDKAGCAQALASLGFMAYRQDEFAKAKAYFEESLTIRRAMGDRSGVASVLTNLGLAAYGSGEYDAAHKHYEESLAIRRAMGDRTNIAPTLNSLGEVARILGDLDRAEKLYQESLVLCREAGSKNGIAVLLQNLGHVMKFRGDLDRARQYYEESMVLARELGSKQTMAGCLSGLGTVAAAMGLPERAARLFGAATKLLSTIGTNLTAADRAEFERSMTVAREQAGDDAFEIAWADGRATPLSEAISYALEAPVPPTTPVPAVLQELHPV